jgi:hypothetical protein
MAPNELQTVLLSPLLSREERAIWITKTSYDRMLYGCAVEDRHEQQFLLELREDGHEHCLSIHASPLEEAIVCLDYLVGLKDTHFKAMGLFNKDYSLRLCPFGAKILDNMLQNSTRRTCFKYMMFTPDHCRALASSGTKTDIQFYCCEFQDEGTAFVEASASRQDETSGPAKLRFFASNPFNDKNWASLLSQIKLECLDFYMFELHSEVSCRAVATAEVQLLELDEVELDDGGAALVESVKKGRSPKELCFVDGNPFDTSERLVTFMNALRGNSNLARLSLPQIDDRQEMRALAAALRENKGLVHLKVKYFSEFDESDITELFASIFLDLAMLRHWDDTDLKKQREVTKVVADMLSVNDRIDAMRFYDDTFDKNNWDAFVAPRLECNQYRMLFHSIQKIGVASTRAAVLARTLAKFSSKAHLVWMLLKQSHDILSSDLDSAHDQTSIPSRKGSRSPSLGRMSGAH